MSETEMRELNAYLAEHVMGWTVMCESLCDPRPVVKNGQQTGDVEINPVAPLPFYSTDPADAMQVLEKCLELGGIELLGNSEDGFDIYKIGEVRRSATGPTLPIVICLFAKKAFTK